MSDGIAAQDRLDRALKDILGEYPEALIYFHEGSRAWRCELSYQGSRGRIDWRGDFATPDEAISAACRTLRAALGVPEPLTDEQVREAQGRPHRDCALGEALIGFLRVLEQRGFTEFEDPSSLDYLLADRLAAGDRAVDAIRQLVEVYQVARTKRGSVARAVEPSGDGEAWLAALDVLDGVAARDPKPENGGAS